MYNLLALKSALPAHQGTIYYVNPTHIVSFYKSNTDDSTIIYMIDNKTYNVQETPAELASAFGEVWSW